jgi:hypothetical protein
MTSIGFRYAIDRSFIDILKELHFLSLNGMPTKRYIDFHGRSRAQAALMEGLREAYSLLFIQQPDADRLGVGRIVETLKQLYEGKKSDMMINGIANTFVTMCRYARETDFAAFGEEPAQPPRPQASPGDDGPSVVARQPAQAAAADQPEPLRLEPEADMRPQAALATEPAPVAEPIATADRTLAAEPSPVAEPTFAVEPTPAAKPTPAAEAGPAGSPAAPEPESLILTLEAESDAQPPVAAAQAPQAPGPQETTVPQPAAVAVEPTAGTPEPILLELETEIRPEKDVASPDAAPSVGPSSAPEPQSLILTLEAESDAQPPVAAAQAPQASAPQETTVPQPAAVAPEPKADAPEPILLELETEIRPEKDAAPAAAPTLASQPAAAPSPAQTRPYVPSLDPAERAALLRPMPPEPSPDEAAPSNQAEAAKADVQAANSFVLRIESAPTPSQAAPANKANSGVEGTPPQAAPDACTAPSCPIQIVLPHTNDVAVYDAIFASLKRHLLSSE